jgi:hypothetical protein
VTSVKLVTTVRISGKMAPEAMQTNVPSPEKLLSRMTVLYARELRHRLIWASKKEAQELSPQARVALWNAAVAILLKNSR